MDNRDDRWDELTDALYRMRGRLEHALAEAQRRFATAPDEPFSVQALQAMVAVAMDWRAEAAIPEMLADLAFMSDANVSADQGWSEAIPDELCSFVGWPPRVVLDDLMTHINSTSIDVRAVRCSRIPLDRRMGIGTDPIVVDVGIGLGELAGRQIRKVREGTVCWDACLDALGSETLDYGVAYSTSFDFTDYDDEVVKELLRN